VSRLLAGAALAGALALVAAGAAVGQRRQREAEVSPLPSSENTGPRGLAAARRFLEETGRTAIRQTDAGPPPPPGATVILAAPRAALDEAEAAALLSHASEGGTLVLTLGGAPQPALERRLGLSSGPGPAPPLAAALAPHPLFVGLLLPASGAALSSTASGALPVSGRRLAASALSIPLGRGEAIVLSGPEPLENAHLAEADAVALLVRLAARGPVILDERFLVPRGAPAPPSLRALALLALQALLAAALLLGARAPRLGAIRPPPADAPGRTARDYLASLAALYRRAGAEPELARAAWGAFRRRLERRTGIPARLADADAAGRLARRSRPAAEALRSGAAALEGRRTGALLAATRAAADAEAALAPRRR